MRYTVHMLWFSTNLIGIAGTTILLVAFFQNQRGTWRRESLVYDLSNTIGGLLLAWYGWQLGAWPFVVLNSIWFLYSLRDVLQDLRRT